MDDGQMTHVRASGLKLPISCHRLVFGEEEGRAICQSKRLGWLDARTAEVLADRGHESADPGFSTNCSRRARAARVTVKRCRALIGNRWREWRGGLPACDERPGDGRSTSGEKAFNIPAGAALREEEIPGHNSRLFPLASMPVIGNRRLRPQRGRAWDGQLPCFHRKSAKPGIASGKFRCSCRTETAGHGHRRPTGSIQHIRVLLCRNFGNLNKIGQIGRLSGLAMFSACSVSSSNCDSFWLRNESHRS